MNKNLKTLLVAATVATFAASAHDSTNALVDSSGKAVRNSFGQCVEVTTNPSLAECGVKAPAQTDVNFTIGAHTLFATAKADLRQAGMAELQALAEKINGKSVKGLKSISSVKVVGHTDSRGSVAYNQGLSERRAATVRNYLVQLGVPANMISAYGEGEMSPVATNDTAEGRQQNRRVNITVSGVESKK
ncbi:MAG: OmpA family protein [Gammaproteobacteria bacterium]|nr:OmpA family protein [Gammaproteobacteria bacterium]